MKLALEKGSASLQVFRDLRLVVEWAKGTYRMQNLTLSPLLEQVRVAAEQFNEISYAHVKREHNKQADEL